MHWKLLHWVEGFSVPKIAKGKSHDSRVRCVGHPLISIGMGEHLRSVWRALNEVGVNAGLVDIFGPQGAYDRELQQQLSDHMVDNLGDGVNIYCINGDEIDRALELLQGRNPMAANSKNIIYPAWELEAYPNEWARKLEQFDEVWAQSEFTRNSIAKSVGIPVIHMPLPCEVRRRALRGRRHFGMRESSYVFLFSFDFLSFMGRKNPFAVIDAFSRVLKERPSVDAALVMKLNNAEKQPELKAKLDAVIEPLKDRVVLLNQTLSDAEMKSLIWLSDCFVSLHRSEGFGFGLAEAMSMGKPVIATAYSGNMDYCLPETSILVPYELIPLRAGDYPHWEGQHWADADVQSASESMIALLDDPEWGRALGRRAQTHMAVHMGYLPGGLRYLSRIRELEARNDGVTELAAS